MQHSLAQLEYARAAASDRERTARAHWVTVTHPPPPRPARRRAAAALARLAWRLDREAALRAWP
ncbi:MAG: hypothetical protein QOJ07_256 [Thermoleophilaceae bacterium]|nr:hypothetical protein [Thermoleophilaceae bacterium]